LLVPGIFSPTVAGVILQADSGLSTFHGTTSYDITFPSKDPTLGTIQWESKLAFDLGATLWHVGLGAGFFQNRLILKGSYAKSVDEYGGKVRDQDWNYNSVVNSVYEPLMGDTLSDINSKVKIYSVQAEWTGVRFGKNDHGRFFMSGGYERQDFGTFTLYDIDGYYSGLLSSDGSVQTIDKTYTDPVGTYKVNYDIIYTLFGLGYHVGKFEFKTDVRVGALDYRDHDEHLLRKKTCISTGTGLLGGWDADVVWRPWKGLSLDLSGRITSLSADGRQIQTFYDGSGILPIPVDDHLSSYQTDLGLTLAYAFDLHPSSSAASQSK